MTPQLRLQDSANLASPFPDGRRCRFLKSDEASGMMTEGVVRMGTCGARGGDCYDRECDGCTFYEASRCSGTDTTARTSGRMPSPAG